MPDLSTVRTLIPSVTKLANHLGLTINGIYRWIKVNRIPGAHVVKVANFYDVEIKDLLPLTGSDQANVSTVVAKPKNTLSVLLEVYRGNKTVEEACAEVGISAISAKLILTHWGDELPTLYTTLTQLDEKRISLETAMLRLNVTKYTLHGLRAKYGFAPGHIKKTRPESQMPARRAAQREVALRVIAGTMTTIEAAELVGASYRSVFRFIERLTTVRLNQLAKWPQSFRLALAEEIDKNMPNYAQKWVEFAEKMRVFLRNNPKYPKTPTNWRNLPLKRLLVGVLIGEETLENIAASRKADPTILRNLFTSDLRPLDLTFEELQGLPMAHQTAFAELLLSISDRKRRVVS